MKTYPVQYFFKMLLLSLFCLIAGYAVFYSVGEKAKFNLFEFLLIFLFCINFSIHLIVIKKTEKIPKKFFGIYMISTAVRLILYLVVAVIGFYILKSDIKLFLISFVVLYLAFTFFETISLTNYFKNKG